MMGIMTDPSFSAQQLIEDVFIGGGCFEVSNVSVIGNAQGIGYFNNGTSSVGIEEGVIIASGAIGNSAGPNNVTNITTNFFDNTGDPDLDILATANVFDAVGIQFDFTPVVNTVQFRYVFASDEYCDYVNSTFNDVFGFFISGPGINGGFSNNGENIALVPGTNQDVAINTVNIQTNSAYYVDNVPVGQAQNAGGCVAEDLNNPGAAETEIEYDGFTTVLTATANVQTCETYRIRMVVGDVNDGIFDSAVLLEANSFDLGGDVSMDIDLPGLESSGIAYEGCTGDGFIIFERPPDSNINLPVDVYFTISSLSTATNGLDYTNLPPFITIPAGQTQFLLPLEIYEDFIAEGTETLILELDNPCTCQDASIEIQISDTPPMTVTTPDLEFCNETSTTLFADVAGGIPGYTYQWSTGGMTPTITIDATTGTQTYTVTVTDDCGNQEISTSTVTVAEEAFAVIEGFAEVCEANPNGILTITFTGSGPWDLIYMINGVPQPPIVGITENPYFLVASEPGTYTIGSIMVAGCPGTGDGSGIILPTIFNSFVIPTPVSCPGEFDGSIDFLVTGGSPEYTYAWSNDQFTEDIEFLEPGIYTVTVTDMNGCTHVNSGEILSADSIMASVVELQGVDCLDTLSGAADLTVNGGTPGYTYLWDNGSMLEDPDNLSAGVHTVMITDSLGCTAEAEVTITQDAVPPVAIAEPEGPLNCEAIQIIIDGSASSGTGTLEYSWLDSGNTEIGTNASVEVTTPGTYTLIVTNQENGCSDEITVNVEQDIIAPTPTASGGILTCDTSVVTLDATGSSGNGTLNYSWLNTGGTEIGTTQMLDVDTPGLYTLIITDESNGCTAELEVEVEQDETLPEAQANPSGILTCIEGTITLDGSTSSGNGTINYEWLDPDGTSISTATEIDVDAPGTYTLIITDESNGCTAEVEVEAEQNIDEPTPDVSVDGILNCEITSTMLDASGSNSNGGTSYQWLNGTTEIGTDPQINVDAPGTYTLIVTDEVSGCTAEATVDVEQDIEEPIPDASVSGLLTCEQLSVMLDGASSSGNGILEYEWQNSNGQTIGSEETLDVEDTGVYTLIITDNSNGCTAETSIEVDEDITPPQADAGDNGVLNCDANTVNLDGSASSQGDNIAYEWLNESNVSIGETVSVDVLEAGTYTLIVTNTDNGCTAEAQVTIETDDDVPEADALVDGVLNCNEEEALLDGSASSANGTISYEWSNAGGTQITTEATTTVATPGIYTLLITDTDNGCTAQTTVEVLENLNDPTPNILDPDQLTCDNALIQLDASTSNGQGSLSYEWQNEGGDELGTESTLDVENAGTFTLIITDAENGCTATTQIVVEEDLNTPSPEATANGILTCTNGIITLDAGASSGIGMLSYQWLDETNTELSTEVTNEVDQPGVYTLIITDENNGCTASTEISVDQDINDPVSVTIGDGILNCSFNAVNLDGSGSSGTNPINFQWLDDSGDPVATTPGIDVSETGTYTLIVTDQENGCTNSSTITVNSNFDTPDPDAVADGILTCENLSVILDGTSSASSGEISFEWFFNNNEIGTEAMIEVAETGTYTLIITDQESTCTETIDLEVDENIVPPIADAGPNATLTCDTETVQLNGENSSIGATITYEWTNAGGVTVSTLPNAEVSEAGIYNLVVTNTENGCTASAQVAVEPDENLPTADAGEGALLTCDILEVTLNGSNSSAGMNMSYEWLDPSGAAFDSALEITVDQPGTYTLIVTDGSNGCSTTASVEVEQNIDDPLADPGTSPTLTCDQTVVLLDGSASVSSLGALDFQWLDTNDLPIGTTPAIEVETAGFYTLIVTAENGCSHTAQIEVLLDDNVPVADPGSNGILTCDIPIITLGGAGTSTGSDITYEWLNSSGEIVGTEATLDVTEADTYTLQVLNSSNNCATSAQVIIDEDIILPQVDAGVGGTLTCNTTEFILGGLNTSSGSNYTYQWTDENGMVISTDSVYSASLPGLYTLTVLNTENNCSASDAIEVEQNIEEPIADPGSQQTLTCDQTSVQLDGSASTSSIGNLEFQWLDINNLPIDSVATINVEIAGIYTLIVTAENGCTNAAQIEVLQDANVPIADPGSNGVLNCDVSVITLGGAGTSTGGDIVYEWLNSNGEVVGTDATFDASEPDTYTLNVINTANNCETSAQAIVEEDINLPQADAGVDNTLTCTTTEFVLGGSSTSVGLNITYEWTDESGDIISTDSMHTVTNPGLYTLTVFNINNGCETTAQVWIDQDIQAPVSDAGEGGVLTCEVSEITLDGSASSGDNLTYQWLNEMEVPVSDVVSISVSEAGVYTLVVTNTENGCTDSAEVNVTPDENIPTAIGTADGILTCAVDEVLLDASSSTSVSGNIAYEWQDTNGVFLGDDPDLIVSTPGIYTIVVTDTDNGCTTNALVEVPQDIIAPEALAGNDDTLTCSITELQLNGTANNGMNLSFNWLDDNNISIGQTPDISVSTAGIYTLIVTNGNNGCSASDQVEIIPDTDLPLALAGPNDTLTCAVTAVILDATGSAEGANITYAWENSNSEVIANGLQVEVSEAGVYTIIVTDNENNCVSEDVVAIVEDVEEPTAAIDGIGPIELNCDINAVVLNAENSIPFNDLSFEWSTTNGNITTALDQYEIEVNAVGTYTLLVTDQTNGCTDTHIYNVGENVTPPTAFINNPPIINCYNPQVTVNAVNTSGNGTYEFSWTALDNTGIIDGENSLNLIVDQPGTYLLNIENTENGCDFSIETEVMADVEAPDAAASSEDVLDCITPSVGLDGSGSSTGSIYTYEWQGTGLVNGTNSLSPTVNQPGTYLLVVTNTQNGCTETASTIVEENGNIPTDLVLDILPPPCPGDPAGIQVSEVIGGEPPYLFSIDGGANFYDLTYFYGLEPGNYNVVVQDAIGCEYGEEVSIDPATDVFVQIQLGLEEIELGDTVQLGAIVNVPEASLSSIVWEPSTSLSCDDCLDPLAFPQNTVTYTLTVANQNGCEATDKITLRVRKSRGIYIPNVFTPLNGDGINDIFHIFSDGKSVRNINSFQVFDRWGELVFEDYNFLPDDPVHGWDGTLRGEPMNPAVFVYWAAVEFIDGEVIIFKGDVTLVR